MPIRVATGSSMTSISTKCELLAPAGSLKALSAAIAAGADAVYVGGEGFNMRGWIPGLGENDLRIAVDIANANGRRIYVTVNTCVREKDLPDLRAYLSTLGKIRPDALIVWDAATISLCRRLAPEVRLHLSTMANVLNSRAAEFWSEQGIQRVCLARELSLAEIAEITKQSDACEFEIFAHGSICIAYAGHCLLTDYLSKGESRRGTCRRLCRGEFFLMRANEEGHALPVFEEADGTYMLNPSDLCMVEHIPEILASGVHSIKIEGRQRGERYTYGVIRVYREALDCATRGESVEELLDDWLTTLRLHSPRTLSTGFYFSDRSKGAKLT